MASPRPFPGLSGRGAFAALALITILLGLAIHFSGALLPDTARDILGDALWAMMIAWLVGVLAPHGSRWNRAAVALVFCWIVEFGQLYRAPLLDAARATSLGHLALGSDFDARDLMAYAMGVLSASLLEPVLLRVIRSPKSQRTGPA